jgi:hypothetical protein
MDHQRKVIAGEWDYVDWHIKEGVSRGLFPASYLGETT